MGLLEETGARIMLVFVLFLCQIGNSQFGQSAPFASVEDALDYLGQSPEADREKAWRAVRKLREARREQIQKLMEIVRDNREQAKGEAPYALACLALGDARAVEATELLVSCLEIQPEGYQPTQAGPDFPTFYYYPAAVALAKIGHPKVMRALQTVIGDPKASPLRRKLAVVTWIYLEMGDPAESYDSYVPLVVDRLKSLLAKRVSDEEKLLLLQAIDWCITYTDSTGSPQENLEFLP